MPVRTSACRAAGACPAGNPISVWKVGISEKYCWSWSGRGVSGFARGGRRRTRARAATQPRGQAFPSRRMAVYRHGVGERLAQTEVGGRKRVGKTQGAHGDVLRRPFADAANARATARSRRGRWPWGRTAVRRARRRHARSRIVCAFRAGACRWRRGRAVRVGQRGRGRREPRKRAKGVSNGSPKRAASRPARVVAPATLTCWPSTARTASSNTSHAPGTRRPGCARTDAASAGSRPR